MAAFSLGDQIGSADRDRYGRLLRYVYWHNGNLNLYVIKQAFAYEYTYERPYRFMTEFKAVQKITQVRL
jgi:endonuclease YncB( thermonuclease family)